MPSFATWKTPPSGHHRHTLQIAGIGGRSSSREIPERALRDLMPINSNGVSEDDRPRHPTSQTRGTLWNGPNSQLEGFGSVLDSQEVTTNMCRAGVPTADGALLGFLWILAAESLFRHQPSWRGVCPFVCPFVCLSRPLRSLSESYVVSRGFGL